MYSNNGMNDFMGYRYMIVEEKIEQCLEAAKRGETSVTIDRSDLTDREAEYIQQEVKKRILNGRF